MIRPCHRPLSLLAPAILLLLGVLHGAEAGADPKSPEQFYGHAVGEDRALLSWDQILSYMEHLDDESDRVELLELGRSTEGRPFVMMVVADEDGLDDQRRLRSRVRELYQVDSTSRQRAREIAREERAIVAFSLGVHSTEVGAPQASVEIVHQLATAETPVAKEVRENLLVLLVPCMNPDGLEIVRQWYEKTLGTEAEGTPPLDLYHPYAGHDNNRDGFYNNLDETAYWSRVLYHDWLPQMIVDEHQMGSSGPRLFLPPFDDPISDSVHPLVYSQLAAAGQQVVSDLTALGHRGIATQTIFTAEWPGSVRSTGFWHNMLGILSEVASARLATPLHFPDGSLEGRGRGLSEYERRTNFLEPWPGGWWRLRDIIDLEIDLTWGFLRWASDRKEDLLFNFWQMNRDAVAAGRSVAPFAFVIPAEEQHDPAAGRRMVEILRDGGVEVEWSAQTLRFGRHVVDDGAWVVRAGQPFRPFVLEMLGQTEYPMVREGRDQDVIRPYDVTAWSLPDLLGATVLEVEEGADLESFELGDEPDDALADAADLAGVWVTLPARDRRSYRLALGLLRRGADVRRVLQDDRLAPGDFLARAEEKAWREVLDGGETLGPARDDLNEIASSFELELPRLGIFAPWGGSKDEGWTRLVLDRHDFPYRRLRPGQPELSSPDEGRDLRRNLDVLLLPSVDRGELEEGRQSAGQARVHDALWPEEYRRGLGAAEAGAALRAFVEEGGVLVALNHSVDWVVDYVGLPVRLELGGLSRSEFYAPGTLVQGVVDPTHPLGWGMPPRTAFYFARGEAFRPIAWPRPTRVVGRYADRDALVGGFLQGEEHLEGRPALVEVPVGRGCVVLFGFSPQRRAQTEATYKLLLNALLRQPDEG